MPRAYNFTTQPHSSNPRLKVKKYGALCAVRGQVAAQSARTHARARQMPSAMSIKCAYYQVVYKVSSARCAPRARWTWTCARAPPPNRPHNLWSTAGPGSRRCALHGACGAAPIAGPAPGRAG